MKIYKYKENQMWQSQLKRHFYIYMQHKNVYKKTFFFLKHFLNIDFFCTLLELYFFDFFLFNLFLSFSYFHT